MSFLGENQVRCDAISKVKIPFDLFPHNSIDSVLSVKISFISVKAHTFRTIISQTDIKAKL